MWDRRRNDPATSGKPGSQGIVQDNRKVICDTGATVKGSYRPMHHNGPMLGKPEFPLMIACIVSFHHNGRPMG